MNKMDKKTVFNSNLLLIASKLNRVENRFEYMA